METRCCQPKPGTTRARGTRRASLPSSPAPAVPFPASQHRWFPAESPVTDTLPAATSSPSPTCMHLRARLLYQPYSVAWLGTGCVGASLQSSRGRICAVALSRATNNCSSRGRAGAHGCPLCLSSSTILIPRKGWHMLLNLCFHIAMTAAIFAGGITLTGYLIVCQAVGTRGEGTATTRFPGLLCNLQSPARRGFTLPRPAGR